jgi:hypothetical protein
MHMANNTKEITREEALKKVANVIEEALDEFDLLSKMDFEMVQDPSREEREEEKKNQDDKEIEKADDEMPAPAAEAEEDKDQEEDKKDDDKDEDKDESDEDVKKSYEHALGKMKARGLVKSEAPVQAKSQEVKADAKKEEIITKSESPKAEEPKSDKTEVLAKAYDARFEALTKTVSDLSETIKKISSAPAPRKGLSGYTPLRKSEEDGKSLTKAETIEKLFDLQKSGNRQVDPSLINRVETGRVTAADLEFINKTIG